MRGKQTRRGMCTLDKEKKVFEERNKNKKKYRMVDNMFEKRLLLSLIAPRQKSFKTGVNERVSIRILGGIGGCRGSTPGVFCRNIYVYIYIYLLHPLYIVPSLYKVLR